MVESVDWELSKLNIKYSNENIGCKESRLAHNLNSRNEHAQNSKFLFQTLYVFTARVLRHLAKFRW